jgi:hypothetical protein
MRLASLIWNLTIEDTIRYSKETDKLIWIETNLLDPNNLPRHHAEQVEEVLIGLLDWT